MVNDILLELLNGNTGIVTLSLTVICIVYLVHETIALGIPAAWDWRSQSTRRMRLALAIMTFAVGIGIRSAEVTRWRMDGAIQDELSQSWLTFGSAVAMLGALCIIRELSKPLWGDGPWIWTLAVMFFYTIAAMLRFV